ncbi:MAG: ParA family protein [Amphritea sp.]
MTYIIGLVSQKGGVGKSTLARLIAREAAAEGLETKIADLDTKQTTCTKWAARRAENGIEPSIRVEPFADADSALKESTNFDLYIFDGRPHSDKQTQRVARAADLVVIPTNVWTDDLEPSVLLAHDLFNDGIPVNRIVFALCMVPESAKQIAQAREYLSHTPYRVLDGDVPFKTAFGDSLDKGRAITETPFRTLVKRADKLAQSIVDAAAKAGHQTMEVA